MLSTMWSSSDASEVLFLIGAILAAVAVVVGLVQQAWISALIPAAVCLVALGLLAL